MNKREFIYVLNIIDFQHLISTSLDLKLFILGMKITDYSLDRCKEIFAQVVRTDSSQNGQKL